MPGRRWRPGVAAVAGGRVVGPSVMVLVTAAAMRFAVMGVVTGAVVIGAVLVVASGARSGRALAVVGMVGVVIRPGVLVTCGGGVWTRCILAVVVAVMVVVWATRTGAGLVPVVRLVAEAAAVRVAAVAAILGPMAGACVAVPVAGVAVRARAGVVAGNRDGVGVFAVVAAMAGVGRRRSRALAARLVPVRVCIIVMRMRAGCVSLILRCFGHIPPRHLLSGKAMPRRLLFRNTRLR